MKGEEFQLGVGMTFFDFFPPRSPPVSLMRSSNRMFVNCVFPPGNHFSFHQLWWRRS